MRSVPPAHFPKVLHSEHLRKVKKLSQTTAQKDKKLEIMRQLWKFQLRIEMELQKEQRRRRGGNNYNMIFKNSIIELKKDTSFHIEGA